MLISYVVTFYNKAVFLPALVRSIAAQEGPFEKQLIVSDDASDAGQLQEVQAFAASFNAFPIKVIPSAENTGPAQCFNRGMAAATGDVIVAIDADDVLAPGATHYYMQRLEESGAEFVYARRRRADHKKANATSHVVIDDPLAYVASNSVVHMCFAAKSALLREVGGADPRLFIQDQSLAFRMAAKSRRMVRSDVTTVFIGSDHEGISVNKAQQHHDRFWTVMNFIDDHPELPRKLEARMKNVAHSSLWKMHRDHHRFPIFSRYFMTYLTGRLPLMEASREVLKARADHLFRFADVQRVGSQPPKTYAG